MAAISPPDVGRVGSTEPGAERGMVTAELALGMVSAIFVLIFGCWAIVLGVLQLGCIDTAAETARQAARGDQQAVRSAEADAPRGATVTVKTVGDRVVVDVALFARPGGLRLPAVRLSAHAETLLEPS